MASLVTGRVSWVVAIFSITTLVRLSVPGWSWVTFANGYLLGGERSSVRSTMEPTLISWEEWCHFEIDCSRWRYWVDHCCQISWVILWMSCHLDSRDAFILSKLGSGNELIALPMRKCPGVSALTSSGSLLSDSSGLELSKPSIWVSKVAETSTVSRFSPMARRKWNFIYFITASHLPPVCGTAGWLNIHWVPSFIRELYKVEFSRWAFLKRVFSSLSAPMKFVPQSE